MTTTRLELMDLSNRLSNYYSNKFKLEILKYCGPSQLLKREQHYINLCFPEYNILKIAGSPLGSKCSP